MHISEWKKSIREGYILCDSNYMTIWERQTVEIIKRISGFGDLPEVEEA